MKDRDCADLREYLKSATTADRLADLIRAEEDETRGLAIGKNETVIVYATNADGIRYRLGHVDRWLAAENPSHFWHAVDRIRWGHIKDMQKEDKGEVT
jgi:hypothetical protein